MAKPVVKASVSKAVNNVAASPANNEAAAAAAAAAPQQEQQQGRLGQMISSLRYYALIFLAFNFISSAFKTSQQDSQSLSQESTVPSKAASSPIVITPNLTASTFKIIQEPTVKFTEHLNAENKTLEQAIYENSLAEPVYLSPMFDLSSTAFSLKLYINDQTDVLNLVDSEPPFVSLDNVTIDSVNNRYFSDLKVPLNENLRNNGTLYLHCYIGKTGGSSSAEQIWGYKRFQLNTYLPKKKEAKLHNLIAGKEEEGEGDQEPVPTEETQEIRPIVSYWHPNITIALTNPPEGLTSKKSIPDPIYQAVILDPLNRRDNLTGQVCQYYPLMYQNKFWQLKQHMNIINSTLDSLQLNLNVEFSPFWKTQMLLLFQDSMTQQQDQSNSPFGASLSDGSEFDSFKKILIETNPYLLAITVTVSILHSLLEFLAFKNDISHWRKKKDNVGVSVRSIVANVVQQLITLLYLVDNSEGTSLMILGSQGVGILVEAWKITTIVNVEVKWDSAIPTVVITDKYELSETEQKTQEYDSIAFKYLYWVSVPLLLAYAVYSVVYKEHKSWYSFIITTLVGFVYTYGFLTLVPSVYINYRLKSVAHVPKKAMAYKVVNTFIDDLFAFVIKMPWLHRLATLRDDVIFFIYLYQCWIYRVDYERVNEFGQVGDETEEKVLEKKEK
ncbi:hypothetical protein WICPIJ_007183 [Wickerhamomyces pijperi]|uniref:Cleft lip and palate transmembrane protein 1 n=1 Tax=Wickerhamomyces pijperi TaxID=599730 RepID=A0A9P8Q126_WICPI|nr:hypothetical protein WICPIJ_007183 [Wickerhamomyces pijperi]